MVKVIVHAGFHKTGTTSLQAFLERNRKPLKPHADIYLKTDLKTARFLGRWYGQRPVFWRRWLFRRGFRKFLNGIPAAKTIVLSRESFSGIMLGYHANGRRPRQTYAPVASTLALEIIRGLKKRFGPGVQITFLYTLRNGENLLQSLHGHILKTSPLTEDFATFCQTFGPAPDLKAEAEKIRQAIAPVPVETATLESLADHRFGPAKAILDLLDLPPDLLKNLKPATRNNPGQSEALRRKFLAMNRTSNRARDLKTQKQLLADQERRRRPRP